MTHAIRLVPAAQSDLDGASSWYDERQSGLGNELLEEAYHYFDLVADHPQMYAIVYRKARQALLVRFPYAVYFVMEPKRVVIYAIIHTSRDPSVWQARIP